MNTQFHISTPSRTPVDITTDSYDEGDRTPLSSFNFGPESFMSPAPTRYSPRSSPPALCRDRKRLRRTALNTNFAEAYPELNLPTFDDDEEDLGRPKKFCIVQRLEHPVFKEHVRRNLFGLSRPPLSNRSLSLPLCAPKVDPSKPMKRSTSVKIQGNTSTSPNQTILIGVDTQGKPRKFERRLSTSALSA
jgi:hypothetical protein